jgi:hypothetical protein
MDTIINEGLKGLGVIGLLGIYVWLKSWMYRKEYKDETHIIKRGSEWDYEHKGNENKKNK